MYGISNGQQKGNGGGGSANYTKIESTIPTSAWVSSAPSWIGQNALTWTEKNEGRYYVQGGTEDLGLSSSGSYSAVLTIDGTDYSADAEGILPADGTFVYAGYFNNNNIELNIIDHCVGFDDNGEAIAGNGYLVMVLYIRGTVPSSVIVKSFSAVGGISAIISNSAIKVNSAVTMYIDYNGKIKAGEKADGSITVSADETPTENIPYTLQVVETSTEGTFEIVNSYVPVIPTDNSELTNGAGYITNTPEHLYLTDTSTGKLYEVTVANGTISLVEQSST